MITDRIRALDDATALRLLPAAAALCPSGCSPTPPAPDLRDALLDTFGPPSVPGSADGEVARCALLLVAEDPARHAGLTALLDGPRQTNPVIVIVGIVAALLVILQTHVRIERLPTGKWRIVVEKQPASDGLLETIAHGLVRMLGAGQPTVPPRH